MDEPPIVIDDRHLVDAALTDGRLHPPVAPTSLGAGSTAALRDRMARFSCGEAHETRRASVERAIDRIDVDTLRWVAADATSWYLERSGATVDAHTLAASVPTVALASALGWRNARSDALVDDVQRLAGAIGRGDVADARTDAAVDRLLGRAGDHPGNPDAAVSLLYQNADATAALLLSRLEALATGADRSPAVRSTVRVASESLRLSGSDEAIEIAEGQEVQLDLTAGAREFGHGAHACPGRHLAEAIVDGVLAALDDAGLSPSVVERADGSAGTIELAGASRVAEATGG